MTQPPLHSGSSAGGNDTGKCGVDTCGQGQVIRVLRSGQDTAVWHPLPVQPLVVLTGAEQVKLAVFLVVVAPDTFEAGGAIAESVGQDADFGLAERHHFAFEEAKKRLFLAHVVLLFV